MLLLLELLAHNRNIKLLHLSTISPVIGTNLKLRIGVISAGTGKTVLLKKTTF
jgi:hypothetical protein